MKGPTRNELSTDFDEAANRAASYVRRQYPDLVGVLVHGSVAREEPGPFSDVDLLAVTNHGRKPSEFSYFDRDIYVGVGFMRVAELKKEFTDRKAFFWTRGGAVASKMLYDAKGLLRRSLAGWRRTKTLAPSPGNNSLGHVPQHDSSTMAS